MSVELGNLRIFIIYRGVIIIAKKIGQYVKCECCGSDVYKTPYQLKRHKHHFCSNKCQGLKKRADTFEYRKCEICGSEMYISKKSTQRFCSQICQNKWQSEKTGFENTKFQGGYVVCENCGKEFIVGKTILESSRHHFCSTDCRQHWYSNVWSKSEEWRDESRRRATQLLQNNVVTTQTKPQIAINSMLDQIGINYRNEEPFTYYSADNYLIDYNLVIEVMGDYWHGSPLKYPDKLNDRQRHVVSRDKAKRTYLHNQFDIDILYLWESDILKNPDMCRALIMEYINRAGVLPNYHSFNYELRGGNLYIISDLIIPYQQGRKEIAC